MTKKREMQAEPVRKQGRRRGDGGTYLAVVDGTDESVTAIAMAARYAETSRGHVGLLHVIDVEDFQHWSGIENMMRKELRDEAEKHIWAAARMVNDMNGHIPVLYIREGNTQDEVIALIEEDPGIVMLVLGGSVQQSGPGPLVNYVTGKGLSRMQVPVMVVPENIDKSRID